MKNKSSIKIAINEIAKIGSIHKSIPNIKDVKIFKQYFNKNGDLKINDLNEDDGTNCTRREILTRYLFLNSVLDQGPDTEGIRNLLSKTINDLYAKEIRILHSPIDFFNYLGIVIDNIDKVHNYIKNHTDRPILWARFNNSNSIRYNLFMDNSHQTLNYAVFRWGVPLAVIWVLMNKNNNSKEVLLDYLEDDNDKLYPSSSEIMSRKIKEHKKLGLGKAIGDKAAHLFAKWIVHTYPLTRKSNEISWGKYSFEFPFDSNAGRVLFRIGFFLTFSDFKDLKLCDFIQFNKGKNNNHYIRVTNIRNVKATLNTDLINPLLYNTLCINHLKTNKRNIARYDMQKIPSVFLLEEDTYSVGDFDDGLMYIGTNFCSNNNTPNCKKCPANKICNGFKFDNSLIIDYKT